MKSSKRKPEGFTLLEVLVTLSVLGIGAALVLSLISGTLRNIRQVQLRTSVIQHAETVMELSLLDESIKGPISLRGDFQDGTRWSLLVTEFQMPKEELLSAQSPELPMKLLSYSVEVVAPGSNSTDFTLQTLKLIGTRETALAPINVQ